MANATFTTSAFTVAAAVHAITFTGLNPKGGDNTCFIDQVTISSASPPPGRLGALISTGTSATSGHSGGHRHGLGDTFHKDDANDDVHKPSQRRVKGHHGFDSDDWESD